MLYVTTRNIKDAFTVSHAVNRDRCPEGGLFVPYQFPAFTENELEAITDKPFGQLVADILNHFIGCKLSAQDIDLCIGKAPVAITSMSHKITVSELWHNPNNDFSGIINNITQRLNPEYGAGETASNWMRIAVRIAVLFGIFSLLKQFEVLESGQKFDLSVAIGDFQMPIAAIYARQMGLPIGSIICGCNQNGVLWDLINHGQIKTDTVAIKTLTPKCDCVISPDLERLIFMKLGVDEVLKYNDLCARGRVYAPSEEEIASIADGLFAAVVSDRRTLNVINSAYRTNQYLFDPYTALAFAALQDYRAVAGETRPSVIISESSPLGNSEIVANALGISQQELLDRINAR